MTLTDRCPSVVRFAGGLAVHPTLANDNDQQMIPGTINSDSSGILVIGIARRVGRRRRAKPRIITAAFDPTLRANIYDR
jgi:hypothetical protein